MKRSTLRRQLQSNLDQADAAGHEIGALLREAAPHCGFGVELCGRECLNNAVVHGNRYAADKAVELFLRVGRKWVFLRVTDEGAGFDWRRLLRSHRVANDSVNGRGLAILSAYADRVSFNRSGNSVSLWFRKKKEA
jgi:anti-sigma regulatory factor (Ser/Thr protein kinase)